MKKEVVHDSGPILGNSMPQDVVSEKRYFILPLDLSYYTQLWKNLFKVTIILLIFSRYFQVFAF